MERNYQEFLRRKGCQALEGAALPMAQSPPLEVSKEWLKVALAALGWEIKQGLGTG